MRVFLEQLNASGAAPIEPLTRQEMLTVLKSVQQVKGLALGGINEQEQVIDVDG